MLEKHIQKSILDYLTMKRVFHWRNNSGAMFSEYKGKKRMLKFGAVGSPDIFAIKDGKIYGLEVKNEKGKLSENQLDFCLDMSAAGGIYKLVRSIDDVVKLGL